MQTPRRNPQHIRLQRTGAGEVFFTLLLDGHPFPYLVSIFDIETSADAVPAVTITLHAERIEVINDIRSPSDKDDRA